MHDADKASSQMHDADEEVEASSQTTMPEKHQWFLRREICKLTTMIFFSNMQNLLSKSINSRDEIYSAVNYLLEHMEQQFFESSESIHEFYRVPDIIWKSFKIVLLLLMFILRLLIVLLLLLQWLDEYSWNCVIGLIKNYCEDTKGGYIFDQLVVESCFYIIVLMAIIIAKFMKNMPVNKLLSSRKVALQSENALNNQRSTLDNQQSTPCPNRQSKNISLPMLLSWLHLIFKKVDYTIFLTDVSFVLIVALTYASILNQFTYVAITETQRDVSSNKTFNIDSKWLNVSISGGVSNSV